MVLLKEKGFEEAWILKLWEQFNDEYFLRHQNDEISWQMEGILNHRPGKPLILILEVKNGYEHLGGQSICLYP
ncbi:hypothetical protein [Endozoicomonas sp.]|uniref:hypothetical protein n=1 Tax=Endozoicomonas sp. TaxID=1892382 RepID=UPI003AF7736A